MQFSVPSSTHAHVAIVGAGPRGTSSLERICASAGEFLAPGARLTIHVVDPSPPGAGVVWRTKQSPHLLMNTVTSQITMFTDDSVVCDGPIRPGPSLYSWGKDHNLGLGPDDYSSRAEYGVYLEWVFGEILRRAPANVDVEVHAALAVRLENSQDGRQVITLSTGGTITGLSGVVLAQGHLPLLPDPQLEKLGAYAKQNSLRHFPPANPADVDLSSIAPGEPVLLRGLGLNFFDYMSLLTNGRGGTFTRTPNGLQYNPSGKEPRMYAASRRGIPYQARGDNAKGAFGRHMPLVITDDVITRFRERANNGDAPDFKTEIWPMVAKEVETVYYEAMLAQDGSDRIEEFEQKFLSIPHEDPEENQVLEEFGIPEANRWSWERLQRPQGDRVFTSAEEWRNWVVAYLREDIEQAKLNNVDGPLKAALDLMRDLRNEVRLIVDHKGVTGNSYQNDLDRWYTPLNAFTSIGPPRLRTEQMTALIEAGVLDVLGPRIQVESTDGAWLASSPEVPNSTVRVTTLIEARLPEPHLRNTADQLLSNLMKTGQARPHTIDGYETGGLDVTNSPFRLIDCNGIPHPRRFAVGVPTEGVHWVTAAGARPGVNSVTLCDTDAVARGALQAAQTDLRVAETQSVNGSAFATDNARIALGLFWQRNMPIV